MSAKVVTLKDRRGVTLPDSLQVKISTSTGHQGKVVNSKIAWPDLCAKLGTTAWDSVTMEEYLAKPIAWQDKRKNQGYFVGGQFTGGSRKITAISERTLLTFDIDNCSPELLADLELGSNWLGDYEYFLYTTRKHTPAKPRVRVVVPVSKSVPTVQYGPLARIIAEHLDAEMVSVDPVSFRPAQIMYWPNSCKGSEFIACRNKGALLDPDKQLREYGDWQDYSKLPRSPREKDLRAAGTAVTDPVTKRGLVGGFCRAYSVSAAIETFLSDVYELGEGNADGTPRYSYLPGSTRNGAVLYDDDKHLYSHHGTDPCADKLVNAFDMVRLHKFGHLDKPTEEGADPADPKDAISFKSMTEFLKDDASVTAEMRDDNYDFEAMFGEGDEPEPEAAPEPEAPAAEELDEGGVHVSVKPEVASKDDPEWRERLDVNEDGLIRSTLHNVILILENDPRFKGCLAHNEFIQEDVLVKRIRSAQYGHDTGKIVNVETGDFITAEASAAIRAIIEAPRGQGKSGYGIKVSDRDMKDAVAVVASSHRFHPVKSYLRAVKWDGVPRIKRLLSTYADATDNEYVQTVCYNIMVAGVQRIFEPGCKFDFVLILEGMQGKGKSSFIAALAGPSRFGEMRGNLEDTAKVVEQLQGNWILEIPELSQFQRTEIEVIKAMFSAQKDRTRLAYGRGAKTYMRQCIFWGTTNKRVYLKDEENRRFWPVKVTDDEIDLEAVARDRDLLWAEAYQCYIWERNRQKDKTKPLPLYLRGEVNTFHRALVGARTEVNSDDMSLGMVQAWLDTPVPASVAKIGFRGNPEDHAASDDEPMVSRRTTCLKDIMFYVFGKQDRDEDKGFSMKLSRVMADLKGWHRTPGTHHVSKALGNQRIWTRDFKRTPIKN